MQGKEYSEPKHDNFVNDAYNREVVSITLDYMKLLQSQQTIDHRSSTIDHRPLITGRTSVPSPRDRRSSSLASPALVGKVESVQPFPHQSDCDVIG